MKFPVIGKLTIMEKIWVWLIIVFCLLFIIGVYTEINLAIFALIGGFIMNMIMMFLCSSNLNEKIK